MATTAHALLNLIAPQALTEFPAYILTALIRVEQQTLRSATLLIGHRQRLHDQIGIRACRERPANNPAREQVEYGGQIMPTTLRPDILDVTTPDLIAHANLEFTIEMVRDIDSLNRGLLVGIAPRLLADQPEFFYQTANP